MAGRISVQCCIAGGGPAGMMLGLLLARAGGDVLVQERRAWPTHMTQRMQLLLQDRVIKTVLAGDGPLVPPWPLQLIAPISRSPAHSRPPDRHGFPPGTCPDLSCAVAPPH